MDRRQFVVRGLASVAGAAAWISATRALRGRTLANALPTADRRGLLRPPGSLDEDAFLATCIRCQRCSQACDARAIRLFGPGAGALEGTPHVVPEVRACNLCLRCGTVCPTGAIAELDRREDARMGTAVVDERLCVSHNGTGICGACFTVCPLRGRAITQSAHNQPIIHADACVGCGLCEEA